MTDIKAVIIGEAVVVAHPECEPIMVFVEDGKLGATPYKPHPMAADYSREGIFVHHNCWACQNGELPCKEGSPNQCSNPRARND